MKERLQKVMAAAGIGSRRSCEKLIRRGRVSVNGETAALGCRVNTAVDDIRVDGRPLPSKESFVYVMLNKPRKVITTAADEKKRLTVLDLLSDFGRRLYPVGRLDSDSEGLLLLTNDGALAYRLTHPRFGVRKVYRVWLAGRLSAESFRQLSVGVPLDDGPARAEEVVFESRCSGDVLRMTMKEGRNRQVRRMCAAVGQQVKRLQRVQFGPLSLGSLPCGEHRILSGAEVSRLQKAVGLDGP